MKGKIEWNASQHFHCKTLPNNKTEHLTVTQANIHTCTNTQGEWYTSNKRCPLKQHLPSSDIDFSFIMVCYRNATLLYISDILVTILMAVLGTSPEFAIVLWHTLNTFRFINFCILWFLLNVRNYHAMLPHHAIIGESQTNAYRSLFSSVLINGL